MNHQNNTEISPQNSQLLNDIYTKIGEGIGQEVIVFFILFIVIYIRDTVIKTIKNKKIISCYFKKNSESEDIKEKLIDCLKLLECDRVLLMQLHNGDSFLNKVPQVKCTLTHQYTAKVITPIEKINNLPITYLHRELSLLKDGEFHWIARQEAFPGCQVYLENVGVELMGLKLIKNKIGVGIAIIGIHYCSFDFLPIVNDEKIDKEFKNLLLQLEILLQK